MTDQELFLKASIVQGIDDFTNKTTLKVAFMFLIKGKLPLAPLWEKFFKGHEGFYNIYLHQDPSYKDNVHEDSAFYGRKIPSQHVIWGTSSMIDAERRLLANALLDFSNQHFVLLSESCIPLFGFKTIYTYLMNSNLSYVQSFHDPTKDCMGRLQGILYIPTTFKTLLQSPPLSLSLPPYSSPPSPSDHVLSLNSASSNNSNSTSNALKESLMHNMTDQELFVKASMVRGNQENKTTPKVAFMFLAQGALPLSPLWEKFFKGHKGFYNIYLHQHPSFNETVPQDSVFCGRKIPSQPVYWGTLSMIDAEKRLLGNALMDSSNQYFVLLSESCIPLFGFKTIYHYLINSTLSFLSSYDDKTKAGRGRYNSKMSPSINITNWRKGSQWFELHRDLAMQIVSDTKYYTLFRQHCHQPCYPDEHYIPTFVHMMYPEFNSNRSLTFVDWSRGGPHPRKFGWHDITNEFLNQTRYGSRYQHKHGFCPLSFWQQMLEGGALKVIATRQELNSIRLQFRASALKDTSTRTSATSTIAHTTVTFFIIVFYDTQPQCLMS
ncbi:unnamed protein product [Lupinus luteus]|uniref:Core-2/I-branching beta-1,6-N-acetylglucosaminyltransferase family protein n=1 Tax=Lupinus luteus TaxID=3873 RepID=A0AAV1X0X3_LUPLU